MSTAQDGVDKFYTEEVSTQGGGYDRCVICGGTDYDAPGTIKHESACTAEFRNTVFDTVFAWEVEES